MREEKMLCALRFRTKENILLCGDNNMFVFKTKLQLFLQKSIIKTLLVFAKNVNNIHEKEK